MKSKSILSKGWLFIPVVMALFFSGCEKSILTDDPGTVDNRNVKMNIFHYWNKNILNGDSVYSYNGARFMIDEVNVLLADFVFDNNGDSLITDESYTLTNYRSREFKVGYLKSGSVSGRFYLNAGLNPYDNLTTPGDWPAGHVLANESIYNTKAKSYNAVTIKGRIFDPNKPEETEPSIAMSYVIATQALVTELSKSKSFSVPIGKPVLLDVIFDVKGMLKDIFPTSTPVIVSDPADQADYDNAVLLRANFENSFIVQ